MKKKYLTIFLIVLLTAFSLFAQSSKEVVNEEQRIVSLSPAFTELVYALNCGDKLVARTDYCNYPEQCLSVPSIGSSWMPSVEVIVSYNPTVVLVSSLTDPNYVKAMEEAGLNVQRIVFEESLDGTYEMIRMVGKALDKEKEADKLAKESKSRIDKVINKVSTVKNSKSCVYIIGWGEFGDWAGTGDTFINGIIEASGARNVAKEGKAWSISREMLLNEDPDVIILPFYSYQEANPQAFKQTSPYNQLNGKVLTVNGDIAERQGLRTAEAVEEFAKLIYPELF